MLKNTQQSRWIGSTVVILIYNYRLCIFKFQKSFFQEIFVSYFFEAIYVKNDVEPETTGK